MAQYVKPDGAFSLFRNDRRENEKHPEFKGKGTIGGVEYEAALWKRTSKDGNVYLSVQIKPSTYRPNQPKPATRQDAEDIFN